MPVWYTGPWRIPTYVVVSLNHASFYSFFQMDFRLAWSSLSCCSFTIIDVFTSYVHLESLMFESSHSSTTVITVVINNKTVGYSAFMKVDTHEKIDSV